MDLHNDSISFKQKIMQCLRFLNTIVILFIYNTVGVKYYMEVLRNTIMTVTCQIVKRGVTRTP